MHFFLKIYLSVNYRVRKVCLIAIGRKQSLPTTLHYKKSIELIRNFDFSFENILTSYNINFDTLMLVGANDGAELKSKSYSQFKYICAIEPNADLNHELKMNLSKYPKYDIFNFAAGEVLEHTNLYLASNNGQSSSLLKPMIHFNLAPQVKFTEEREVLVKRIDSFVDKLNCPKVWVVDVQGFELNVLKGAGDLLNFVEILYCEVNRGNVYQNCTQYKDLDAYLLTFGLCRVLIRWWGSWGDALYIRKTSLYLKNKSK